MRSRILTATLRQLLLAAELSTKYDTSAYQQTSSVQNLEPATKQRRNLLSIDIPDIARGFVIAGVN